MPIKDAIEKKKAGEQRTGINHRPEVDAKIDNFIAENPETYAKFKSYSHEELVRKRILDIVNDNERRDKYSAEAREYVEQNPAVKEEVLRRVNRLPEAQRQGAFTRHATTLYNAHKLTQAAATSSAKP